MTDNWHEVFDAHGRPANFGSAVHACRCDGHNLAPTLRARHWGKAAVAIVAILTAGLVASVLLLVIRDIVTAVAGASVASFLLKGLVATFGRSDR
ncbi:hypothetical protein [Streptomyces sp. NPDC048256]|uniref:hypothetical protein n=1 Tax=Streptomyces sp. NPDC048256 TaxID=3154613 RepID=UPI0033D27661